MRPSNMQRRRLLILVACFLAEVTTAQGVHAVIVSDNNSTITVDPASQFGLRSWVVDGINQISEQWFWLRLAGESSQTSLDNLFLNKAESRPPNQIDLAYTEIFSGLKADLLYTLSGGPIGSGRSSINENITLANTGDQSIALAWFMEADLDLSGTSGDDLAFGGTGGITQEDPHTIATVRASPAPDAFQIARFPVILEALTGNSIFNLDDRGSPFGPGDATFAFQWNLSIPAGQSLTIDISKDISPAPEPSTISLLVVSVLALLSHIWLQEIHSRGRRRLPPELRNPRGQLGPGLDPMQQVALAGDATIPTTRSSAGTPLIPRSETRVRPNPAQKCPDRL